MDHSIKNKFSVLMNDEYSYYIGQQHTQSENLFYLEFIDDYEKCLWTGFIEKKFLENVACCDVLERDMFGNNPLKLILYIEGTSNHSDETGFEFCTLFFRGKHYWENYALFALICRNNDIMSNIVKIFQLLS